MSRTIKAIERHMILPLPLGPTSRIPPVRSKTRRGELGLQSRASKLVAEWQQRGPETLSGYALRKLRFGLRANAVGDDRECGWLGGCP
jgi:hypothetical protein